jgi:hypothetical protein
MLFPSFFDFFALYPQPVIRALCEKAGVVPSVFIGAFSLSIPRPGSIPRRQLKV